MESINRTGNPSLSLLGKRRVSADDLAYFELRDLISSGEIASDEQVSEEALADLLGLSRTPLRAALSRLRQEGMIDRAPNGRLFVPLLSLENASQLFAVRMILEELALENGFPHIDDKMLRMMANFIDQEDAIRDSHAHDAGQYGGEFHAALYKVGDNSLNLTMLTQIQGQIDRYRFLSFSTRVERQVEAIAEHREILDALVKRDLPLAKIALRKHLEGAFTAVKLALSEQAKEKQSAGRTHA